MKTDYACFFFTKIYENRKEKRKACSSWNSGKRWEKKREADDISCVTKVRVEDKNLDAGDEVCVFYEIRFLNFARWFPRSGSRKDNNGAFATFFPRAKFPSHWWTLVPCTFSETLSVGRVNRAPLAPFAKRDEKKEEEKGRRETSSFVKPETGHHFSPFSSIFDEKLVQKRGSGWLKTIVESITYA